MTQVHYTMQSLVFGSHSLLNRTRRAIKARRLLPWRWTEGENNNSGMHSALFTRNDKAPKEAIPADSPKLAAIHEPTSTDKEVG